MTKSTSKPSAMAEPTQVIVKELNSLGYEITDFWDFLTSRNDHSIAFPMLILHLSREYPELIRVELARAFIHKNAAPFRSQLIDILRSVPDGLNILRYQIATAIAKTTSASNLSETIGLIKDQSLGECRVALLQAIRLIRSRSDIAVLISALKRDPELIRELSSWKMLHPATTAREPNL